MHVSHAWMVTFMRISLTNIHITNYAYFKYIWHLMLGGKSIARKYLDPQSFLGNSCRSVTLYMNSDYTSYKYKCRYPFPDPVTRMLGPRDPNRMVHILRDVSLFPKFCNNLPALRHVHLRYHNRLPFDPKDYFYRFRFFSTTVTDLEITHTFDDDRSHSDFPKSIFDPVHKHYYPDEHELVFLEFPWRLPHIRRLTIRGGNAVLVLTIASRAEGTGGIATDVDSEQMTTVLQHLDLSNMMVTRCSPPVQGVEGKFMTLESRENANKRMRNETWIRLEIARGLYMM
ncbi:hypothetical protein F5146DRAFT_1120951 [Armillaria mellea]|nr:hypothetical protein F5146DRAFT_1120951 [Armillaria mellea]